MINKWWHFVLLAVLIAILTAASFIAIAAAFIYPRLPSLEVITNYQPKQPLQVYSEDGFLIDEFGEERRAYIKIEQVPKIMKDAVLAIEDRRFYQHNGIDTTGILRAIKNNLTGRSHEGASTITMQVAKNFFTTPNEKRDLSTKINEALLAIKIEHSLSKNQILELYINQIYLGQRSYGFAAASQTYYGKSLNQLNLAEAALLAGLPKAPSGYNPFLHPKRAITRQQEVLHDMYRFGFIQEAAYQEALKQPLRFKLSKKVHDLAADYVAEMVRDQLYKKYQDQIYVNGLKVYTTIRKSNQEAANLAVRDGVINYDLRHGYRGPESTINLNGLSESAKQALMTATLEDMIEIGDLVPAVVTKVTPKSVDVFSKNNEVIQITGKGLALVTKVVTNKKTNPTIQLDVGAVVRIIKKDQIWQIVQLPQVESSFVAMNPQTGAITALVGGFDFNKSKFNHAVQAWRQPGSTFKPFIYSAALEKGFTPASVVNDEALNFPAGQIGDKEWTPQNYENEFQGPIRLRVALAKSVNTVAIQVLQSIGGMYAQDYITRFGFAKKDHPAYLTMALGAGSTTNLLMTNAYAVFANGGYRVEPHLIEKIIDQRGKVIFINKTPEVGLDAERVIDARNAFIMNSMLKSVIQSGTAARALKLGRSDIAGKTGTTNDHFDAWFAGYQPKQVAVVWLGYDKPQALGKAETGGFAALPIWIQYMSTVLKDIPESIMPMPDGVMTVKVDPATGASDEDGMDEYFYNETPPPQVEKILPPMLDPIDEYLNDLQTQAQKLLQPEVKSSSDKNMPTRPTDNTQNAASKSDNPNAAAKILNP